jgi:hypothetical protein
MGVAGLEMRRLTMDLNYLFVRQQVERSLATSAASAPARAAHEALARQYELEIERHSGGQIVFPWHRQGAAAERESDYQISGRPTR